MKLTYSPADVEIPVLLKYLKLSIETAQDAAKTCNLLLDDGSSIEGVKTVATYLATQHQPALLGSTDAEKAEVDQWTSYALYTLKPTLAAKVLKNIRETARGLNETLANRVFFAGHSLTLADLFIFCHTYAYIENLNKKQRFEVCNLTRWFDFVQHQEGVALEGKPIIPIDLEEDAAPAGAEASASSAAQQKPKEEGKKEKQEGKGKDKAAEQKPKEKKEAKEAKPKQPVKAEETKIDIYQLDMRVGKILHVKKHPDADSLYVEEIDVGEEKPRQVVSGLVNKIPIEEMQDRMVIVLANLKPANMRGIPSHAMVMCASNDEKVEFVDPPAGSQPGDRIFFEGHEGTPETVLNPKKKIFETLQPDFSTNEQKQATWKDLLWRTDKGICTVRSIVKASIR